MRAYTVSIPNGEAHGNIFAVACDGTVARACKGFPKDRLREPEAHWIGLGYVIGLILADWKERAVQARCNGLTLTGDVLTVRASRTPLTVPGSLTLRVDPHLGAVLSTCEAGGLLLGSMLPSATQLADLICDRFARWQIR